MTNSYNWSHRKLTFEQAEEMRHLYSLGNTSHAKLARQFRVSTTVARFIINNINYKNPVPSPQKVRK